MEITKARESLPQQNTTVAQMLIDRVAKTPDREAFRKPTAEGGWQSFTWKESFDEATLVAAGLLALDLKTEERVGIASNTRTSNPPTTCGLYFLNTNGNANWLNRKGVEYTTPWPPVPNCDRAPNDPTSTRTVTTTPTSLLIHSNSKLNEHHKRTDSTVLIEQLLVRPPSPSCGTLPSMSVE